MMSTPGAQARALGPKLVKGAGLSAPSAATPMTPRSTAGHVGRQLASFPHEATSATLPAFRRLRRRSRMAQARAMGGSSASV